jgi:hypothetical protein
MVSVLVGDPAWTDGNPSATPTVQLLLTCIAKGDDTSLG